jgi:nicotinate-nucleotide pyrophosphorylase (carboxylating)
MHLVELIQRALMEDVGAGDITTLSTIPIGSKSVGIIRAKQELVVCGHEPAEEVFRQLGAVYTPLVAEGSLVPVGTEVARIEGLSRAILTGERLALNFLMKLSGIATHTYHTVAGCSGLRVVDTRKTTPLLRYNERRAVKIGGGHNHRFALYDGILIKDNHIKACGSITIAVESAKQNAHHLLKIEVEVESLTEMEEAIEAGADVVMLDNMTNEQYREAVTLNQGRVLIEASGNMNRERILEIQDIGIDVVSMGGLIHQATWADLSMKFQ